MSTYRQYLILRQCDPNDSSTAVVASVPATQEHHTKKEVRAHLERLYPGATILSCMESFAGKLSRTPEGRYPYLEVHVYSSNHEDGRDRNGSAVERWRVVPGGGADEAR